MPASSLLDQAVCPTGSHCDQTTRAFPDWYMASRGEVVSAVCWMGAGLCHPLSGVDRFDHRSYSAPLDSFQTTTAAPFASSATSSEYAAPARSRFANSITP